MENTESFCAFRHDRPMVLLREYVHKRIASTKNHVVIEKRIMAASVLTYLDL
jgi:hypothetical protein